MALATHTISPAPRTAERRQMKHWGPLYLRANRFTFFVLPCIAVGWDTTNNFIPFVELGWLWFAVGIGNDEDPNEH